MAGFQTIAKVSETGDRCQGLKVLRHSASTAMHSVPVGGYQIFFPLLLSQGFFARLTAMERVL